MGLRAQYGAQAHSRDNERQEQVMGFYQHIRLMIGVMIISSALLAPASAGAQQQAPMAPPAAMATAPMPDQSDIYRMIWGTMAAVDGATMSGNYSVLRDTAAPGFQATNDTTRLAGIFATLRASGTDLSQTMMVIPVFRTPPHLVQQGLLLVQGSFGLRPAAVNFEMLYQWAGGRWRLFGVAIATATAPGQAAANRQPAATPTPAPQRRR
ncbi:hypothetical protein ACVWZA_002617 [Sphingomonas sp. UYAg733]